MIDIRLGDEVQHPAGGVAIVTAVDASGITTQVQHDPLHARGGEVHHYTHAEAEGLYPAWVPIKTYGEDGDISRWDCWMGCTEGFSALRGDQILPPLPLYRTHTGPGHRREAIADAWGHYRQVHRLASEETPSPAPKGN